MKRSVNVGNPCQCTDMSGLRCELKEFWNVACRNIFHGYSDREARRLPPLISWIRVVDYKISEYPQSSKDVSERYEGCKCRHVQV